MTIIEKDDIKNKEVFNTQITLALKTLIENAQIDVEEEWNKVDNKSLLQTQKGSKQTLIKYLKLIYLGDESINLQTNKNSVDALIKSSEEKKDIIKTIIDLEKESNPVQFSKKIEKLNIQSMCDNAISSHLKNIDKIDKKIERLENVRRDYAQSLIDAGNDSTKKQKVIDKFRADHLAVSRFSKSNFLSKTNTSKEKWIREMYLMMFSSKKPRDEDEETTSIQSLELAYDQIFDLKKDGTLRNPNPDFEELRNTFIKRSISSNLLGFNPQDILSKIEISTYSPILDLTTEAMMKQKFKENGQEVNIERYRSEWTENFFHKNCKDKNGNKVDFATLISSGQVLIREGVKNDIRVLFTGKSSVPTHILTNSFSGSAQKVTFMNHDKDGNIYKTLTIRKDTEEIKGQTKTTLVYKFEARSYEIGLEMRLDNLDNNYNMRVGLVKKQRAISGPNGEPQLDQEGKQKVEDYFELSILTDPPLQNPYSKKDQKLLSDIKRRYGDKTFESPEGNKMTVEELLNAKKIQSRPLFSETKAETQTLQSKRNEKAVEDLKKIPKKIKDSTIDVVTKHYATRHIVEDAASKAVSDKKYDESLAKLVAKLSLDDQENSPMFRVEEERRNRVQPHTLVDSDFGPQISGQELLNNDGHLDSLGVFLYLKKEIQMLDENSTLLDRSLDEKAISVLKTQIAEKLTEINNALSVTEESFDYSKYLGERIILQNQRIRYTGNGNVNLPIELWLYNIINDNKIHLFSVQGQNKEVAKQIVKFAKEISLINEIVKNPEKHNVGSNLQDYLDKQIRKASDKLLLEYNQKHNIRSRNR